MSKAAKQIMRADSSLLPSVASDPERASSFSLYSRDSCIERICRVSYRILLLDDQGSRTSPMPPEKEFL